MRGEFWERGLVLRGRGCGRGGDTAYLFCVQSTWKQSFVAVERKKYSDLAAD